jgi:pterin-4a-carbinolamine dehydratase
MAELAVFISYRRDTDAARAVMLDREISGAFNYPRETPKVAIYRDASERLGVAWPQEIRDRCTAADIVLAVIGPNWLEARDQYSRRRIDQPDDWVRQELELALAGNKTLIPVVFGRVGMLPREALPESIADLAERRGVIVRDELPDDLQPVLREIELHLPETAGRNKRKDVGGDRRQLPYPDPPLKIKPAPMTEADIETSLQELLTGWEVISGPLPEDPSQLRVELHRTFTFHTFLDVLAFMAKIADFADKANHHPRWENIYETLRVYLTTWDIGHRISHLDVQLAQFFDRSYRDYRNQLAGTRPSRQSH